MQEHNADVLRGTDHGESLPIVAVSRSPCQAMGEIDMADSQSAGLYVLEYSHPRCRPSGVCSQLRSLGPKISRRNIYPAAEAADY